MQDEPKGIHTELVTPTHPYTAVDVPWEIDTEQQNPLYRYLRGGGLRAGPNRQCGSVRLQTDRRT